MVLHDPQEFGGLEEYAIALAIGLQRQGQDVCVLSTTWVILDNQYVEIEPDESLEVDVRFAFIDGTGISDATINVLS